MTPHAYNYVERQLHGKWMIIGVSPLCEGLGHRVGWVSASC